MPKIEVPTGRIFIPFYGITTFVRSTCLTGIKQSSCGAVIAYRLKCSSQWMMGVIICYRYNQPRTNSSCIELYDFVNVHDVNGIPSVFRLWCELGLNERFTEVSNVLFRRN